MTNPSGFIISSAIYDSLRRSAVVDNLHRFYLESKLSPVLNVTGMRDLGSTTIRLDNLFPKPLISFLSLDILRILGKRGPRFEI